MEGGAGFERDRRCFFDRRSRRSRKKLYYFSIINPKPEKLVRMNLYVAILKWIFCLLLFLVMVSAAAKKVVKWQEQSQVLRPPVVMEPVEGGMVPVTLGDWLDKRISFPQDYRDTTRRKARVVYAVDRMGKWNYSILAEETPVELKEVLEHLLMKFPSRMIAAIDYNSYVNFTDTLQVVWEYPQCYVPGEGRGVPKPFYMETPEGVVKMLSKPTLKEKKLSSLPSWLKKYAALPDGVADRTTWVAYTVTKEGGVSEVAVDPTLSEEVQRVLRCAMDSVPRMKPARTWLREPVAFRDSLPLLLRDGRVYYYSEGEVSRNMDERFPAYEGGWLSDFRRWVMERIRYPQQEAKDRVQGRVLVSFVVDKTGEMVDIRVRLTPSMALADEVLRVLSQSNAWTPGILFGKPVRVRYTLPIDFRIP